jgi:hypothetical protein
LLIFVVSNTDTVFIGTPLINYDRLTAIVIKVP